jgi:hypothetical protein
MTSGFVPELAQPASASASTGSSGNRLWRSREIILIFIGKLFQHRTVEPINIFV